MFKKSQIYNFLFVSFFAIFFQFIPIGLETQPLLPLIGSLVLLFSGYDLAPHIVKKDLVVLYILLLVLLLYAFGSILFYKSPQPIIEFVKYLIGPILFLAMRISNFQISFGVLKKVVYIFLFFALLNFLFPSLYILLFKFFIPRFEDSIADGARGINILTPEPSYFSIFQLILLLSIEKGLSENFNGDKLRIKQLKLLKYIVIFISLLTKSALVIVIALIFLLPNSFKIKLSKRVLAMLIVIPVLVVLISVFYSENRLFQIVGLIFDLLKDSSFDITAFLFTQEASTGTRIILNFIAISSIFFTPFGSGLGSFSNVLFDYAKNFGWDLRDHPVIGMGSSKIYPSTYFANLCNDIGIFSLLLFPVIFLNNDNTDKGFKLKKVLCLLFLLLFQSQITSPAFWFLIAIWKTRPNNFIDFNNC